MRPRLATFAALTFALLVPALDAYAQRGGRGGGGGARGGGMQRGGGGGGGGGMQRGGGGGGGGMQRGGGGGGGGGGGMQRGGGGFGGGMPSGGMSSARGPQGGMQASRSSMGPYGHPGAGTAGAGTRPGMSGGGTRPGMGNSGAARPGVGSGAAARPGTGSGAAARPGTGTRPGVGAGGAGGPASGVGVRPGVGAGGAGGPDSGVGVRPGLGAGGAGGPASGIGVRPGMGAGAPGLGGPDSGIGVRPGMGAGYPGYAGADAAYARRAGTYYADDAALVAQRNTVVAGATAYPAFGPAMYANSANAWQAASMANASAYSNPGYGALAATLGMTAAAARPYDYGANVVTQPTAVYVNGDPTGTPQDYADQAGQIAQAGTAEPPADSSWQPIGVFAMVTDPNSQPTDLFQLAVNGQGTIRGNYHSTQSNETTPLAGSVDTKTQRVAWTIGGDQAPVYEVGLANLTKDQTTMLIHTPDGQQNQFTLIRLPEPQQGAPGAGDGNDGAPAQP